MNVFHVGKWYLAFYKAEQETWLADKSFSMSSALIHITHFPPSTCNGVLDWTNNTLNVISSSRKVLQMNATSKVRCHSYMLGAPSDFPRVKSLMVKWLQQASRWREMYCDDLEVMSLNPARVELGVHSTFFFFFFFFIIHLFYIVWREGQGRYELLMMVGAGGTRTCVHPHVSRPLYHCATDADKSVLLSVVVLEPKI